MWIHRKRMTTAKERLLLRDNEIRSSYLMFFSLLPKISIVNHKSWGHIHVLKHGAETHLDTQEGYASTMNGITLYTKF